jgi:hypothetical protein
MATEGIENIFDVLSDMLNAPVYPDDVLELAATEPVARWQVPQPIHLSRGYVG